MFGATTLNGIPSGGFPWWDFTVRFLIRRRQSEDVSDKFIKFGTCNIHRGTCASRRGPHKFTGTCELKGSFKSELLTLFKCDGPVTDRKCRVRCLEKVAIDLITMIDGDFSEGRDLKLLKLTNCKGFDPNEIPLVREF